MAVKQDSHTESTINLSHGSAMKHREMFYLRPQRFGVWLHFNVDHRSFIQTIFWKVITVMVPRSKIFLKLPTLKLRRLSSFGLNMGISKELLGIIFSFLQSLKSF